MSMEHFEWILAAGQMSIADEQTESDFVHYSKIHSKAINTYGSIPACTHAGKLLLIINACIHINSGQAIYTYVYELQTPISNPSIASYNL